MVLQQLFSALKKGGIDSILEDLYKILELPIVVSDSDYAVLGSMPQHEIGDYVFDQLIQAGRPDRKSMEIFSETKMMYQADQSDTALYMEDGYFKTIPRVYINIKIKDRIVGYIVVAMTQPKDITWVKSVLTIASDIFSLEFERSGITFDKDKSQRASFYEKLIKGTLMQSEIESWLTQMNTYVQAPFSVLSMKPKDASHDLFYLTTTFKSQYPELVSVVEADVIYYLIDKKMFLQNPNLIRELFFEYLKAMPAYVGVSESFDSLMSIQKYKTQSYQALDYGMHQNKAITEFRDSLFEIMIFNLNNTFGESFVHPLLNLLKAYDVENNSYLFETLRVYALSFMNINDTAKLLHIHRNTLQYRLGKIAEIGFVDLDDLEFMLLIYLSYRVL